MYFPALLGLLSAWFRDVHFEIFLLFVVIFIYFIIVCIIILFFFSLYAFHLLFFLFLLLPLLLLRLFSRFLLVTVNQRERPIRHAGRRYPNLFSPQTANKHECKWRKLYLTWYGRPPRPTNACNQMKSRMIKPATTTQYPFLYRPMSIMRDSYFWNNSTTLLRSLYSFLPDRYHRHSNPVRKTKENRSKLGCCLPPPEYILVFSNYKIRRIESSGWIGFAFSNHQWSKFETSWNHYFFFIREAFCANVIVIIMK